MICKTLGHEMKYIKDYNEKEINKDNEKVKYSWNICDTLYEHILYDRITFILKII